MTHQPPQKRGLRAVVAPCPLILPPEPTVKLLLHHTASNLTCNYICVGWHRRGRLYGPEPYPGRAALAPGRAPPEGPVDMVTATEVHAAQMALEAAIVRLQEADRILSPHHKDPDVYQVLCLVPIDGVQRVIGWLRSIKTEGV